jgi:hypothetical protein
VGDESSAISKRVCCERSSRLRSSSLGQYSQGEGRACDPTVFLLPRQNGAVGGHRHLGILGVGSVVPRWAGPLYGGLGSGLCAAGRGRLLVHDDASIELESGRAHGGASQGDVTAAGNVAERWPRVRYMGVCQVRPWDPWLSMTVVEACVAVGSTLRGVFPSL